MLRKTVSLLVAVFMVLTFTACTNTDDGNGVRKNNVNNNMTPFDMNNRDMDMNNRDLDMNRNRTPADTRGTDVRNRVDRDMNILDDDTLNMGRDGRDSNPSVNPNINPNRNQNGIDPINRMPLPNAGR